MKRICIVLIGLLTAGPVLSAGPAKIYEKSLTIPTYGVERPDPNPRFYLDRAYQGAQGRVYPYPMSDVLTNERGDKTYDAVYLENDYIRVCVLPEIGGRIFSALDKTNGYDFFYRQSVIKPSLIGMLGAWISGGVEWNFPHHHRSRTFMPMDYKLVENADGSRTLWLGELERRHRMRLVLAITIYPDTSYIEVTTKIFNRTPVVNSFLCFANPAVAVDENYQVLFPPNTQYVTQHAKNEFAQWPVADARYGGRRYDNVDISWWKNLTRPVSFFAWNYEADFFAGYDHGKQAGVAYIADHHVAPGKKFFTFGCGEQGKMWDKMLTDTDGPYLELMAGAYSDNQPDYSWAQPYEVKVVKQYWFPIRQMNDVKYADLNGAVNLELAGDSAADIAFNTTRRHEQARAVLTADGKIVWSKRVTIGPAEPFAARVDLQSAAAASALRVSLVSADGDTLLSYQRKDYPRTEMPARVEPPAAPKDVKTIEELYLTGLRLEQFHNPKLDPMDYYAEALARDPGDYRVNTQLGIVYCKRGMYAEAVEKLNAAAARATKNYTSPKDGEALYYLGVALKAQRKDAAAYDAFYKAAWSLAWRSAAYYALAQLDCTAGAYEKAFVHLDESLATNMQNTTALNLKTAVLRKRGRAEAALANAEQTLALDPLDPWALHEFSLCRTVVGLTSAARKPLEQMKTAMDRDEQVALEIAADYAGAGLWTEGVGVLELATSKDRLGRRNPMLWYWLGWLHDKRGETDKARDCFKRAADFSPEYCFPFRNESMEVLAKAQEYNASDARAAYYLGNLLYERQPEKAIGEWEKSRRLDDTFATVHRNLAFAYGHMRNDLSAAIASMERAISCDDTDARLFFELDELYESAGVDPAKRLATLDAHAETVAKRDDAVTRYVALQVWAGQYDKAIQTLTTRHFNKWEGGGEIHDTWVDAHLLRGLKRADEKDYARALADLQAALEYPDNLEVGRPEYDQKACRVWCLLGTMYRNTEEDKVRDFLQKATSARVDDPEMRFFQAMACIFLDRREEATPIFNDLVRIGNERLQCAGVDDFFAKFGQKASRNRQLAQAHYIIALGTIIDDKANATEHLKQTLKLDPTHVWAKYALSKAQATVAPQKKED
ncbi:MAG: DUF5107 domain-containing protein [Phycisphaerae bacterium]|nr:DUF5107 domain-containing protein [Phycisphaerae bacterium]